MKQRMQPGTSGVASVRRAMVLIEDGTLDLTSVDIAAARSVGVDVAFCSGPSTPAEACRLVTDGACPLGRPDAVVCALGGEWRPSVEAAWRAEGVPIAAVSATESLQWPAHLGVALGIGFANLGDEEDE